MSEKAPVSIAGIWLDSRVDMDGFSRINNNIPPLGIEHLTVQPVEGRYTVYTSNCMYWYVLKYWELRKINHSVNGSEVGRNAKHYFHMF